MKRYPSLIALLLSMLLAAAPLHAVFAQGDAPATDAPVTGELLDEFAALVEAEMDTFHIPGAAVAVIQGGEVVLSQGFGVRSVESGEPFTPQTQFRIGSTTKSMTSLLIATLVDEGVLSWDTLVSEIYPDYATSDPDLTAQLTVADLMSMGTGLQNSGLDALDWGAWTPDDLFATIAAMPVAGALHEHYAYNNEVYASAAYVALHAADQPVTLDSYTQMMQARIFDPIGLPATVITDERGDLGDNVSASYSFDLINGVTVPAPVQAAPINVVAPAGAVWSTLDDMARYVITQMNGGVTPDGARIVAEDAIAATWATQVEMPAGDPDIDSLGYAMGWVIESYKGNAIRFHDGGWDGYRTMMAIYPESDTALLIFANHSFGDLFNYGLMYAFTDMLAGNDPAPVLDDLHGIFDQNYTIIDAQLGMLPAPHVEPDAVSTLLGSYEGGWAVTLSDDNLLVLSRPYWDVILRPMPVAGVYLGASGAALGATFQFAEDGDQVTLNLDLGTEIITFAKLD